jgi:hypothetical protein
VLLFCREWIERYLFLLWPMLLGDVTHKLDVVVVLGCVLLFCREWIDRYLFLL